MLVSDDSETRTDEGTDLEEDFFFLDFLITSGGGGGESLLVSSSLSLVEVEEDDEEESSDEGSSSPAVSVVCRGVGEGGTEVTEVESEDEDEEEGFAGRDVADVLSFWALLVPSLLFNAELISSLRK